MSLVLLLVACGSTPLTSPSTARTVVNTPPVPDAGADQAVSLGDTVTLDSSGSTDADGDALTHRWKFIRVPTVSAVWSNDIADRDASVTTFMPDVAGTYTASVLVGDGTTSLRDEVDIVVSAVGNTAPVADAGADQAVALGDTVTLDSSGSTDADGDTLTHRWKFLQVPSTSAVWSNDIADRDADVTTFVPDVAGTYTASVLVGDGTESDRDEVDVVVTTSSNTAPVAVVSTSGNTVGSAVTLDCSGSTDPEGDALTYRWKFLGVPSTSALTSNDIADRNAAVTSFTPDVAGLYYPYCRVDDGSLDDGTYEQVQATVGSNTAPVASVSGSSTSGTTGSALTLTAAASTDADGDPLTYRWKVLSVPATSALWSNDIADRDAETTSFVPDVDGTYRFNVRVEDGTDQDEAVLTAVASSGGDTGDSGSPGDTGDTGITTMKVVAVGDTEATWTSGFFRPELSFQVHYINDGSTLLVSDMTFTTAAPGTSQTDADLTSGSGSSCSPDPGYDSCRIKTVEWDPDAAGSYTVAVEFTYGSQVVTTEHDLDVAPSGEIVDVSYASLQQVYMHASPLQVGKGTETVTYKWKFASLPSGSALTAADLTGRTSRRVDFVPDVIGTYRLQLTTTYEGLSTVETQKVDVLDEPYVPADVHYGLVEHLEDVVAVRAGDVDGDGWDDLVAYGPDATAGNDGEISVWYGPFTNASLPKEATYSGLSFMRQGAPSLDRGRVTLTDLNDDGDVDAYLAGDTGAWASWGPLTSGSRETSELEQVAAFSTSDPYQRIWVELEDVSHDGAVDQVWGNMLYSSSPEVYITEGPITSLASVDHTLSSTSGHRFRGGAGGDYTGDGLADLLFVTNYNSNASGTQAGVYVHHGPITASADLESDADIALTFSSATRVSPSATPWLHDLEEPMDFDGDGYGDLLLNAYGPRETVVVTGPFTNGLLTDNLSLVVTNQFDLVRPLGDLDGDGADEFGFAQTYFTTVTELDTDAGLMFVVPGGSTGSWSASDSTQVIAGVHPSQELGEEYWNTWLIAPLDVDGDGDGDLAIGGNVNSAVTLLQVD